MQPAAEGAQGPDAGGTLPGGPAEAGRETRAGQSGIQRTGHSQSTAGGLAEAET